MVSPNPLVDLSSFPVTRQTLHELWSQAAVSQISTSDLSSELRFITVGTSLSDVPAIPQPGDWFWARVDNLMYAFHDVIENTGVSQWLAFGPDRFEIACYATEPIPAGWPVDLIFDRRVRVASAAQNAPVGMNQSGLVMSSTAAQSIGAPTAPSGTWLRVAVDGIVWGDWGKANVAGASPSVVLATAGGNYVIIDAFSGRAPRIGAGVNVPEPIRDPIGRMLMDAANLSGGLLTSEVYYIQFIFTGPRRMRQF